MTRYTIWMGTKRRDGYLASDVADLERRHRESVGLLHDLWVVLDERAKTDVPSGVYLHLRAFLAEEAKHE